ncbi:MAG: hypothetical protein R6U11_04615 [Bacteroidales bacterium]
MTKYKPTKKFKELGIQRDYQGLTVNQFNRLKEGKQVKLNSPPEHLIDGDYIKKVKTKKKSKNKKSKNKKE